MPAAAAPPQDYEALIWLIHENYIQMSKTWQRISVYLTQNPNEVALNSVNAIAQRCGIHASSFVRFAQSFGYKGFKELHALFQKRLTTAAPGFQARIEALASELQVAEDHSEAGLLRDLVVRDIASLQQLVDGVNPQDLALAVDLLERAPIVYLIGQLRSSPVVELLRYTLTMLNKRCILLDPGGGLATHMARTLAPDDVLLAVSFRFYANEVVNVVAEAGERGVNIIAMSDSTLSPLARWARVLFAIPEHDYTFSRSLAAPMCLAQALVIALAARVQDNPQSPRIPTVTGVLGAKWDVDTK